MKSCCIYGGVRKERETATYLSCPEFAFSNLMHQSFVIKALWPGQAHSQEEAMTGFNIHLAI